MKTKRIFLILAVLILIIGGIISSGKAGLSWTSVGKWFNTESASLNRQNISVSGGEKVRVSSEESVVIDVVDRAGPSVVTVSISKPQNTSNFFEIDPFNPFVPFRTQTGTGQPVEQDIGSGFIVSADGLIVTNKHVVGDTEGAYKVITNDDKTYDVVKIFRDPTNDLAILKINPAAGQMLKPVEMGDSSKIKVGQMAIAIGTALGEFRNTVTTGVISGVGRGITAGSPFEGYAERLDNVIQTDAAINPGNSGGPLLNSSGQVIGINTAVSSEGQNVGFALPINVVKDALDNFNKTGQFNRPFLGVRYKVVTKDIAILNEVPEGMYVMEIVANSPAAKAGLEKGDIITKIDGQRLTGTDSELAKVIGTKKPGDKLRVTLWRNGKSVDLDVTLGTQE
jgi:S1-C subfamily serine protease